MSTHYASVCLSASLLYIHVISFTEQFIGLGSPGGSLAKACFPWDFSTLFWFARGCCNKVQHAEGLKH